MAMAMAASPCCCGAAPSGNVHLIKVSVFNLPRQQLKQAWARNGLFQRQQQHSVRRKQCVYAESGSSSAETSFKSTVEIDRFIDKLRSTDSRQLPQLVAENVFAFDNNFWLRLASRAEQCKSNDDKMDYEELASSIMQLVEQIVQKTQEKIESSTEVLMSILYPVVGETSGEILWPPRDPGCLTEMRKELEQRERGGFLDESFLSEVSAQLRQAREDGDKPGLLALIQKVLQLYAATVLSKTSYAKKAGGVVDRAEELLESVISAGDEEWDGLIRSGLDLGGGQANPEDLRSVVKKRMERVLLRTEGGSYKQRVLVEYLKEIERRVEGTIEAFNAPHPD